MMDSVPVTGATSYSFFTDSDENNPSVTAFTEERAISWLMSHPHFKVDFFGDLIAANTICQLHQGLVKPFTHPNAIPGDIDLLAFPQLDPSRAIAMEFKRVKVVSHPDCTATVNRAGEIDRGIIQANAYRALGFHQTYLVIILLDDGRALTTPNPMFRYATGQPVDQVFNIPWRQARDPNVGVIYIKINQMTGKHIDHAHSIGYCIDLRAVPVEQTTEMTNKVRTLLIHP